MYDAYFHSLRSMAYWTKQIGSWMRHGEWELKKKRKNKLHRAIRSLLFLEFQITFVNGNTLKNSNREQTNNQVGAAVGYKRER